MTGQGPSSLSEEDLRTAKVEGKGESKDSENVAPSMDLPVSYVIHTGRVLGKFKPEIAKAHGLSPGPEYGALKAGRSITLPNGQQLHPHQVKEADDPGACLVILRCTAPHQLPLLEETFKQLRDKALGSDVRVVSVVHICSRNVVESEAYSRFKASLFPVDVHHLHVRPPVAPSTLPLLLMWLPRNHRLTQRNFVKITTYQKA